MNQTNKTLTCRCCHAEYDSGAVELLAGYTEYALDRQILEWRCPACGKKVRTPLTFTATGVI